LPIQIKAPLLSSQLFKFWHRAGFLKSRFGFCSGVIGLQ